MGQHRDEDGDGLADRGTVIDPTLLDRQSLAFRDHDGSLHVPDDELEHHAEVVHAPLGMGRHAEPMHLPEAYDAEAWDAGRVGPKSEDEARAALAERIADPQAPDGPEVEGAYDA